ncbi:hypothetical protein [Reyranella sp.]|uniref:hypothetical protein n=1 Tax=Reyranella sp. TaxID=1929291 RepID=UPI002730109A|nr:hypothetical protein [Reyranella sp.]MDP2377790.1 hypothetical protein [Reyranella sp.]
MAQIEYVDFFPPLGQFGGPNQPWPLSAGVDPINLGGHRDQDYLLIAEPVDPTSGLLLGLFGPLGDQPYPDDGDWGWKGVRVTEYVACTTPRSSAPDDTPANTYVNGRLPSAPNFGSALFDGVNPMAPARPTVGEIALLDPDGELDRLLAYIWDGAPLTLKRGARGTPFSTWETAARFTAKAFVPDLNSKRIALRDLGWQLQGPLHTEYYAGTGGLEGDAGRSGVPKPWALGYCFHAEPVLINAAAQILQFHFGSSQAVLALKHGGVALPFHEDYATYELLAAASIPSGWYGTCLAHSLVRPNVDLEYGIRVDVIGDADVVYGHPGPTTRASIVRRIATSRGLNRLDDAAQIDIEAFNRVDIRHAAPVGWYFSSPVSKADALDIVMAGILGYWRIRPDGRLTVGFVESPVIGSSLVFEYKSEGMGEPRKVATAPPRAGTNMSWRFNYGPQGRGDLAPGVDAETAAILEQPARYASSRSPEVAAAFPTAPIVTVENSGFWNEVDAIVEGNRQQGILCVERSRWQWEMQIDPYVDVLGSVGTLLNFNRLGFGPAKPLLSVGIDTLGTNETTFDWWG